MKRPMKTQAEREQKAARRKASRERREANLALREKAEAQAKADDMYWDHTIPAARFAEDYDAAYASATAMGKKSPEVLAREKAEAEAAAAKIVELKAAAVANDNTPKKSMIALAVEAAKAVAAAATLPEPSKSAEESAAVFAAAEEKPIESVKPKGKKPKDKTVENVDAIKVFATFIAAVLEAATKDHKSVWPEGGTPVTADGEVHVDDALVEAGSFEELKRREAKEAKEVVPSDVSPTPSDQAGSETEQATKPQETPQDGSEAAQDGVSSTNNVVQPETSHSTTISSNGDGLSVVAAQPQQPKQQKLNRKERRRLAAEAKKATDAAKTTQQAQNSSDATPGETNPSDHNDEGTSTTTPIPESQCDEKPTPSLDAERVAADADNLKKIPWHKRTAYDNKPDSNVEEVKLLTDQRVPAEPKRPTQEEINAATTEQAPQELRREDDSQTESIPVVEDAPQQVGGTETPEANEAAISAGGVAEGTDTLEGDTKPSEATVVATPSRPVLVTDNTAELEAEAKAFYGKFYNDVRASLLNAAYRSLRIALIAERNKTGNMDIALRNAIKKEAEAYALSAGMKKAA